MNLFITRPPMVTTLLLEGYCYYYQLSIWIKPVFKCTNKSNPDINMKTYLAGQFIASEFIDCRKHSQDWTLLWSVLQCVAPVLLSADSVSVTDQVWTGWSVFTALLNWWNAACTWELCCRLYWVLDCLRSCWGSEDRHDVELVVGEIRKSHSILSNM